MMQGAIRLIRKSRYTKVEYALKYIDIKSLFISKSSIKLNMRLELEEVRVAKLRSEIRGPGATATGARSEATKRCENCTVLTS